MVAFPANFNDPDDSDDPDDPDNLNDHWPDAVEHIQQALEVLVDRHKFPAITYIGLLNFSPPEHDLEFLGEWPAKLEALGIRFVPFGGWDDSDVGPEDQVRLTSDA